MENKDKQAAMALLQKINEVEGFDPASLAVEYADLNSGEKRLRLPVMAQLAWFRLKYPEGRVAVSVTPGKDCFVASARVYHHFTDPVDQFLAEATASRGYLADKPSVSPREWSQTAAVGIALRNAGFGLQFGAAGDAFDSPAVDELGSIVWTNNESGAGPLPAADSNPPGTAVPDPAPLPPRRSGPKETPIQKAMKVMCPIKKHSGKTLGEVLREDPKAIVWVATKFTGDPNVSAAAKLICDEAAASA